MRTQQQKAAWEAIQFQEKMAELHMQRSAPWFLIGNPLTGRPLEAEMAKQAIQEGPK